MLNRGDKVCVSSNINDLPSKEILQNKRWIFSYINENGSQLRNEGKCAQDKIKVWNSENTRGEISQTRSKKSAKREKREKRT